MKENPLYTVGEVSIILRISKKSLYRMMRSGEIGYTQVSIRKKLISLEQLETFREQCECDGIRYDQQRRIYNLTKKVGHE